MGNLGITGSVRSIWGNNANNIFAAGSDDLFHFNGTTWRKILSMEYAEFHYIYGSENKLFISGKEIGIYENNSYSFQFFQADGSLNVVAGSSKNDVFIAGNYKYCVGYDGNSWNRIYGLYESVNFNFAWGLGNGKIIGGGYNRIALYDGSKWHSDQYGSGRVFRDVWSAGMNDNFVTASDGRIFHYNNMLERTIMQTPLNSTIVGIWGFAVDNIYAVSAGSILHYDGTSWTEVYQDSEHSFIAIWGTGPDDLYVISWHPIILHFNGTTWDIMTEGQFENRFYDIWGISNSDIYIASADGLIHYDGDNCSIVETGYNAYPVSVWGSDPDNVYYVDSNWNLIKSFK